MLKIFVKSWFMKCMWNALNAWLDWKNWIKITLYRDMTFLPGVQHNNVVAFRNNGLLHYDQEAEVSREASRKMFQVCSWTKMQPIMWMRIRSFLIWTWYWRHWPPSSRFCLDQWEAGKKVWTNRRRAAMPVSWRTWRVQLQFSAGHLLLFLIVLLLLSQLDSHPDFDIS